MVAVLGQCVFEGLRMVDKKSAKEAVLFADNPVAAAIPADENDGGRGGAARGRFYELHGDFPFRDGNTRAPGHRLLRMFGDDGPNLMLRAPNIAAAGFE